MIPTRPAATLPVTLLRAARAPDAGLGGAPLDLAALAAFRADGPADHGWSRWLAKPPRLLMAEADHFGMGGPAVLRQVAAELASPPSRPERWIRAWRRRWRWCGGIPWPCWTASRGGGDA